MEQIQAGEQLDNVAVACVPWMEEGDRSETLSELRRLAAGPTPEVDRDKWGGGYGKDVESVSMESLKEELRRGVSG